MLSICTFTKKYVIESVTDKVHGVSGGHHSGKESITGLASGDEHSSWPICDYLALSSVLKSAVQYVFSKSYPSQHADVIYRQSEHSAHPTVLFLRGPLCTLLSTLENIFLSIGRALKIFFHAKETIQEKMLRLTGSDILRCPYCHMEKMTFWALLYTDSG